MRNYRKKLTCTLIVVAILITTMSIAYAALSTTLTITGSANVQAATWDIRLTEKIEPKVTGSATYTKPTIDGTTLRDYSVSLKKPGDAVEFQYYIFNGGDFSATISSLANSTPVCTSSTGNETDAKAICDNLNIEFEIRGNERTQKIGDIIGTGSANSSSVSPICSAGSTTSTFDATIYLKISLKNTIDAYVGSNVSISNLKHDVILTITNEECRYYTCFVAGTKVLTDKGHTNIEDIKVGDYVWSINEKGQRELKQVYYKYNNFTNRLQKILVGRELIETTPEHKIYVIGKGYVRADSIKKGDRLYGVKDGFVISNETYSYKATIPVYNMEVDDNHNYLVTESEFLVHNPYP